MTPLPTSPLHAGFARSLACAAGLALAGMMSVPAQAQEALPRGQPGAPAVSQGAAADGTAQERAGAGAGAGSLMPRTASGSLPQPNPPALARDPGLPHDLSPVGMFRAADVVVKAVMIGLAIASVVTWTVLLVKALELWSASARARSGIGRLRQAATLREALETTGRRGDPVSHMVRAAAQEYDRSAPALDAAGDAGLKERVASQLERVEAMAGRRMARGTGVLATIGSTAPFVGLFGTVWGIMNSFIGISQSQTTNLAVVAPGIAEALLATALGLVAAIPAVVIYNLFARAVTGYRLRLADAAAAVRQTVSRDLDFRGRPPVCPGADAAAFPAPAPQPGA